MARGGLVARPRGSTMRTVSGVQSSILADDADQEVAAIETHGPMSALLTIGCCK